MLWTVAYNRPTRTWAASGGKPSDYERPYDEIFQVEAADRDDAEAQARALRRQQRALTEGQRTLLGSLLEEIKGEPDPLSLCIEIDVDEVRSGEGLRKKGLVDYASGDNRQVRLTQYALNFLA